MSQFFGFSSILLSFIVLASGCNSVDKPSVANTSSSYSQKSNSQTKPKPLVSKWRPRHISGVRTTAYSHLENEPGAYKNQTAIGTVLRYGAIRSAAADWSRYPLGTQFRISGHPHIYEVEDFGSALVGTGTIDLYKPTLAAMNKWGLRYVEIDIVKWGSYKRSAAILSKRTQYPHCRKMYYSILAKLKAGYN